MLELQKNTKLKETFLFFNYATSILGLVKELLMRGADPTIVNDDGATPISCATSLYMVNTFITAAMPMKEVNMRAVFQESKKFAACVNTFMHSYQVACNQMHKIKCTADLISYVGQAMSVGLLGFAVYKGRSLIKSHDFKACLKQTWHPLVAGISALTVAALSSKIYKRTADYDFMFGSRRNLFTDNDKLRSQASVLQQEIKDALQKKIATRVFSAHLQVPIDAMRQDLINHFDLHGANSLAEKSNGFCSDLL